VSWRATGFAVTVLCLMLVERISTVLLDREPVQVPFTVLLFVLPVLYVFPGPRRCLERYRWLVLAAQGAATWAPFAVFGGAWQQGIDGLLAGLVLLMIGGRLSWLLAGLLLTADVTLRATVTGLPSPTVWFGVVWVVVYYVNDALVFFGLVRLVQIVGEVEEARRQAEDLAVARERLRAAEALQAAVGERLASIAAKAAAAFQALPRDQAQARAQIASSGVAAREAAAQARRVTVREDVPGEQPAGPVRAAISARLAWTVLVTVLVMFAATNSGYIVQAHYDARLLVLTIGAIAACSVLQLYHSMRCARTAGHGGGR
jgi:signal transduction histidine kinase